MEFLMVSVEDDDLAGLEDVSSEGEDDSYEAEAEMSDGETVPSGVASGRRPYKKKARDNAEPLPLMEGEGRSFRVLGFNQNQRTAFVQLMMRFGLVDDDWKEYTLRMKKKTLKEIRDYVALFLSHIYEDITDDLNFSDGVPKEGLRIPDVLVRLATLMLIREKVEDASNNLGAPIFADDVLFRYPGLKAGKFWKEEQDLTLLCAVLKHGYGRWQAILDDKDLRIQDIICHELNLPIISLPIAGQSGPQGQNCASMLSTGLSVNHSGENGPRNVEADAAQGTTSALQGTSEAANQAPCYPDSPIMYHFRDMQRRQVEFIKKRVALLEKGLNAEYQKEYFADKSNGGTSEEPQNQAPSVQHPPSAETKLLDQLPQLDSFVPAEISAAACDNDPDRLELPRLYNEMCNVVSERSLASEQTSMANQLVNQDLRKNPVLLDAICEDINRILSRAGKIPAASAQPISIPNQPSDVNSNKDVEMEELVTGSPEVSAVADDPSSLHTRKIEKSEAGS